MHRAAVLAGLVSLLAACSGSATGVRTTPRPSVSARPAPPAATATPPPLPAYAVQALRVRAYPGGRLEIGAQISGGQGYTKHEITWPSGGQTMTGTISLPDGPGPFPVVVVNHGYIPASRYWVGQDSGIFGDPMAAHGFISVAPNWPGYAGSGPGPPELPAIVGELVTMLDLVSSVASSLPQADIRRLACVGHSNGGGICMLAMVVDPRFKAIVLHGPISSDMADNARKWWLSSPGQAGSLGNPDANPVGYRQLSPRTYFARGQPPVLILHGTDDSTCPLEWQQATLAALQAAGVRSEMQQFPGAVHDFVGDNLAQAVAAQEAWIRNGVGAA
jgi:dipeptidyl aminopeptidase/acylaminoacyl peptidase